jgi:hypothetical protein
MKHLTLRAFAVVLALLVAVPGVASAAGPVRSSFTIDAATDLTAYTCWQLTPTLAQYHATATGSATGYFAGDEWITNWPNTTAPMTMYQVAAVA